MTVIEQIMLHLYHAAWQATIVAAAVLAADRFVGLSPRVRHALLAIALLKFAMPPMLAFPTGLFSFLPALNQATSLERELLASTNPLLLPFAVLYGAGCAIAGIRVVRIARRVRAIRSASTPVEAEAALIDLRSLRGALRIRRDVTLLESDAVTVPFATGWARATIVVPSSIIASPDSRKSVLAHELAHISRHDLFWRHLAAVLGVIWWFHPMLAAIRRRMLAASESCCDDLAVSLPLVTVPAYRRALVEVSEIASRRTYEWTAAMSSEASSLRDRLTRLSTSPAGRPGRMQLLLVLLAAALLLPGHRISHGSTIARIEIGDFSSPHDSDHAAKHAARHSHGH